MFSVSLCLHEFQDFQVPVGIDIMSGGGRGAVLLLLKKFHAQNNGKDYY